MHCVGPSDPPWTSLLPCLPTHHRCCCHLSSPLPRVHCVGPQTHPLPLPHRLTTLDPLLSYFSLACTVLAPHTSPSQSCHLAPLFCLLSLSVRSDPPLGPVHHPAAICQCLSYPTPPHRLLLHLGPLDATQTPPLPFPHPLGPPLPPPS